MAALDFVGRRRKQAAMFLAYAFVTPVGIALGTGVRTVFEPNNPSTIIAIGVLDSISAGVLLYGALVDLLAKEFLFGAMLDASDCRLAVALASLLFGAGVMSLREYLPKRHRDDISSLISPLLVRSLHLRYSGQVGLKNEHHAWPRLCALVLSVTDLTLYYRHRLLQLHP